MPSFNKATVLKIIEDKKDIQKAKILIDDIETIAVSYVSTAGKLQVGDRVIVNTTARELNLGSGGYDFILANLDNIRHSTLHKSKGHIIKMRYTPIQSEYLSVEEQNSPYREKIKDFKSLNKTPVILCPLHSMVAPAASVIKFIAKKESKRLNVSYIMTDSAALPIHISKTTGELKEKELIDSTITVGQAFGGDYEAVNVYTGLIAAKEIAKSNLIIISPGPGKVGTDTKYGFSEIEMGSIVDAVNSLGGTPVFIPRINFSDNNYRHYGLSKHSITILKEICKTKTNIVFPIMSNEKKLVIEETVKKNNLNETHDIFTCESKIVSEAINQYNLSLNTMGKNFTDDEEFFKCAAAGAIYSMSLLIKSNYEIKKWESNG